MQQLQCHPLINHASLKLIGILLSQAFHGQSVHVAAPNTRRHFKRVMKAPDPDPLLLQIHGGNACRVQLLRVGIRKMPNRGQNAFTCISRFGDNPFLHNKNQYPSEGFKKHGAKYLICSDQGQGIRGTPASSGSVNPLGMASMLL